MKLVKSQLKQIIKEEFNNMLKEADYTYGPLGTGLTRTRIPAPEDRQSVDPTVENVIQNAMAKSAEDGGRPEVIEAALRISVAAKSWRMRARSRWGPILDFIDKEVPGAWSHLEKNRPERVIIDEAIIEIGRL